MPAGVPFSAFQDLVDHCLAHFDDKGSFEVALEQQNYLVVDEWFANNKIQTQGGKRIEYRVVLGHNGSARMVDPMEPTVRNHTDNGKMAFSPWVLAEGTVTWNEVVASQFTASTDLLGYMKAQYYVGYQAHLHLLEQQGFAVPDNTDDSKNARGVSYWVNFLDTGSTDFTGGFNGKTAIYGDGTTTTNIGGIDKATEPLWRNWAANYSGTCDAACLDAIELGLQFTDFKAPRAVGEYANVKRPNRRIYSGLTQAAQYQRLRNMGNDDRNGDVRPFGFMGNRNFSGVEWHGMATLEARSYSPIYVLDMPNFFPFVNRGWYMKKTPAMNSNSQPLDWSSFLYTQFNFACKMPRRQAVYHQQF